MAVVLHGYDPKLRRDVAIKMMQPDRLHDPRMAARFAREARLAAQINDPHVITVYSVHDESELPFIVMEYL
ncbi:MAG: protein kinase, partial [Maioricimonas sp. JB045]